MPKCKIMGGWMPPAVLSCIRAVSTVSSVQNLKAPHCEGNDPSISGLLLLVYGRSGYSRVPRNGYGLPVFYLDTGRLRRWKKCRYKADGSYLGNDSASLLPIRGIRFPISAHFGRRLWPAGASKLEIRDPVEIRSGAMDTTLGRT